LICLYTAPHKGSVPRAADVALDRPQHRQIMHNQLVFLFNNRPLRTSRVQTVRDI
jgi:hypothetical protein